MFSGVFNQSFFYLLLVVNVSIICILLIAKVRRLQQKLLTLEINTCNELNFLKKLWWHTWTLAVG